jgi:hypothetical protein
MLGIICYSHCLSHIGNNLVLTKKKLKKKGLTHNRERLIIITCWLKMRTHLRVNELHGKKIVLFQRCSIDHHELHGKKIVLIQSVPIDHHQHHWWCRVEASDDTKGIGEDKIPGFLLCKCLGSSRFWPATAAARTMYKWIGSNGHTPLKLYHSSPGQPWQQAP